MGNSAGLIGLLVFLAVLALGIALSRRGGRDLGATDFYLQKDRVISTVQHTVATGLVELTGDGSYDFEIVGEASYQHVLEKIAGPKTEEGHEHHCRAEILPEPTNLHDRNAMRVEINGMTVGYLPRDVAKIVARTLSGKPHVRGFVADAVIVGGWIRSRGREGNYGVNLDIGED